MDAGEIVGKKHRGCEGAPVMGSKQLKSAWDATRHVDPVQEVALLPLAVLKSFEGLSSQRAPEFHHYPFST